MALTEANYRAAAKRAGVPVWLLKAQVGQESGGRQGARSPVGASGVEQLMPATAAALAKKYKVNTRTPFGNLLAGAYYLREQYNAFKRWDLALAAYNAGPGAVHEHGGIPPFHETQHYVSTIMRNAAQIRKQYGSVPSIQPQEPLSAPHSPGAAPSFNPREFALQQLGELSKGSYDPVGSLEQLHQSMMAQAQAAKLKQTSGIGTMMGGAGAQVQALNNVKIQGKMTPHDARAINLARQYLGTPYVWGGEKPGGFDCSGLLQFIWAKQGVKIPRTTYDQWQAGAQVGKKGLRPGDAVFFRGSDARGNLPGHVGIYIGGGKFIEAPHTGAVVRISKLAGRKDYVGARRYG
jgi:cell wall-associated NlpC family hydrolase